MKGRTTSRLRASSLPGLRLRLRVRRETTGAAMPLTAEERRARQAEYARQSRARAKARREAEAAADQPKSRGSVHSNAVDRMLAATGLDHAEDEAPLVEVLKELAAEMDLADGVRPRQVYLAALRDVRRALDVSAQRGLPVTSPPVSEAAEQPVVRNDLSAFKQSRGIA